MLTFEAQPIQGAGPILEKLTVKSPPSLCPLLSVEKAPFLIFARFCGTLGFTRLTRWSAWLCLYVFVRHIESSLPESAAFGFDAGCAADEWGRASRPGHRLPTCRLTLFPPLFSLSFLSF